MKLTRFFFAFLLLLVFAGCAPDAPQEEPQKESQKTHKPAAREQKSRRIASPKELKRPKTGARGNKPKIDTAADAGEPDLTPAECETRDSIVRFMEAEDAESTLKLLDDVKKSSNTSLKEDYLKALGWVGPEVLPEIHAFLADKEENVVVEAQVQWTDCLYRIEDEADKEEVILYSLTKIDNEFIATSASEELANLPKTAALEIVLEGLLNGTTAGREAAKSAYETIIGEPFTTADAAQKEIAEALADEE